MTQINKIIARYEQSAVKVVKKNPYLLMETIEGFGFRRADDIALKTGVKKEDKTRIHAGLIYATTKELEEGHTWIEEQELLYKASFLLQLDRLDGEEIISTHLDRLLHLKKLVSYSYAGRSVIALPTFFFMENYLFKKLHSKTLETSPLARLKAGISTMTHSQREGFIGAVENSIYLISGPAGSGKTHVLKQLVDYFQNQGLTITLCAPTGKAARRLEQVCGISASTIHRLLGYNGSKFKHNRNNPIITDVLLVDELSMIDCWLFYHLMDAIDTKNTRMVFAGDHNQLPPVGPGNVLRDIIQRKLIPYTLLTEVVRQAGSLKRNSLKILNGKVHGIRQNDIKNPDWLVGTRYSDRKELIHKILRLYDYFLPRHYKNLITDIQVLSPMKKHRIGTDNLNRILQIFLQQKIFGREITPVPEDKKPKLYSGDKVIQTQNDYRLGVMNGHMGIVKIADYRHNNFIIDFENRGELKLKSSNLKHISLAYALTVHKVQGSEFPCVISIIHSSHTHMLHRNLFYTSVSRAKDKSIILGDRLGIKRAARNIQVDRRRTFLSILGEV